MFNYRDNKIIKDIVSAEPLRDTMFDDIATREGQLLTIRNNIQLNILTIFKNRLDLPIHRTSRLCELIYTITCIE